jgi:S-DNA-T family DNA segregation ATPase FtsK/SpoIIIE
MSRLILSVSEIRRQLYWAAGGPEAQGAGEPALPLLGTLFHGVYGALTGGDKTVNLVPPLERADTELDSWKAVLTRHAYGWLVGPALAEHRIEISGKTRQLLVFWAAVRALVGWLAEVLWAQRQAGRSIASIYSTLFRAHELELAVEFTDPTWTDAVVVEGRIDAVLTQPATGVPCVVELKTGRASPEADLCQAALYHALLSEAESRRNARLALVTFGPERVERLFDATQLKDAQCALKALIGRLAGVAGNVPTRRAAIDATPVRRTAAKRAVHRASDGASHSDLAERLVAAFAEFGVRLRFEGKPLLGPRFARFLAVPERGVRVGQVKELAECVWMRLGTSQPPHISLEQGRVAIDVERPDPQIAHWRDARERLDGRRAEGVSRFPVGVAVDGSLRWADLAEPQDCHFLVAGTTGSGKSEWLRAMLASLMAVNGPETLRLVLIDPKRTAFRAFEGSPFLTSHGVVHPSDTDVTSVLAELIDEMERRYRLIADQSVQNLAELNRVAPALPRLVCVCDEFADLLAGDRKQRQILEEQVARLGAKARAAGVHLVFATQRPSRDVIKGVIDVNLVARVALKVQKPTDSRLVIDHPGAATLLGKGDLLFKDVGEPVRLQSPFVDDSDLAELLQPRR